MGKKNQVLESELKKIMTRWEKSGTLTLNCRRILRIRNLKREVVS